MTFITGYQNRKGPYVTNVTSGHSGIGTNKNDPNDVLIWNVSVRNTGGTSQKLFNIYDNAASTDHTSTPDESFNIFDMCLDAGDEDEHLQGVCDWNMETPILARNGFYAKGDDDIDFTIMYTVLPQSNPYDSITSPSAGDSARRASLVPNLVCCKAAGSVLNTTLDVSERDCEIWGIYAWNTATSGAKMLRVKDGSSTLASFRLGFSGANNSHMFQKFAIPLYAKGGIELISKDEGGGSPNLAGIIVTVLYREFEHSGRDLDSSARL
jgi:hypothetical protein